MDIRSEQNTFVQILWDPSRTHAQVDISKMVAEKPVTVRITSISPNISVTKMSSNVTMKMTDHKWNHL